MVTITKTAEYGYRFLYSLGGGALLFTVGPFRRTDRRLLTEIALHYGYRQPGSPPSVLAQVALTDLVPPSTPVQLHHPDEHDGGVSLYELYVLASVVRHAQPRAILEIGTFHGRTTLNLAANAPPDCVTYTLDLPVAELERTAHAVEPQERQFIEKPASGDLFQGTEEAARIRQIFGDSATFDFSPYARSIDVVFVDGSHSYEYVRNDSLRALEVIRPGGVILWHDYGVLYPGCTRALNELRALGGPWSGLRRIRDTSLAYLRAG